MGLSWQQDPLSSRAIGRFLVPEPLPKRLLYVEPLRRRMRVSFEPNIVSVQLDGNPLRLDPGQTVIPHGPDRNLTAGEALPGDKQQ